MDDIEKFWADEFYGALMDSSRGSTRSLQAGQFRVGVSDIGFCSERLRRTLLHQTPDPTDELLAWIGTGLGEAAENAICAKFPDLIKQATVTLPLDIDGVHYEIPGHPDLIDPVHGILWDGKTDYGLTIIARTGPTDQQQYQRHNYAYAAHLAGFFPNHTLEEIHVGNFWIDRAGIDKGLHVDLEPFNPEWVERGKEWLGEVIYATRQTLSGNEVIAQKEPPREMCYVVCGFAAECRGDDTDVEGLLTDPVVTASLEAYVEGMEHNRIGKRLQEQGKAHLMNVQGYSKTHILRWVWVNETENRNGYWKIDVKPRKDIATPSPEGGTA